MPTLLGSGSSAYMVRTKNFFRNWSVPAEYRAEYTRIFQGWATFVEKASPQIRDDLKRGQQTNGSYLTHLEPLLEKLGNKFSDSSEQATKAAAAMGSPNCVCDGSICKAIVSHCGGGSDSMRIGCNCAPTDLDHCPRAVGHEKQTQERHNAKAD